MPNFPDINPGAHVAVNTGFGMTAATPLDLRTIVTNLDVLDAMIAAHWMCEGMLVYDLNTKKYYQIYTNDQNQIDRKLFEIEASQIETATTADHLSHSVTINGVLTDFSGTEVNINRLMPTLISNYAQDFAATTTPGQYYGADGDSNNYLLTIEAIGDDKLIRTMITIENGHIVTKQAIGTLNGGVWTWGEWTLADGSVATAHILWVAPNAYVNVPGGSLAERWICSDAGSQYPANAATVQTADGQLFTVAAPPTAAIEHPFVIRLFSDGVTKTATVESLKATNDIFGKVKLSDATNDNNSGVNAGIAATPKAVASLDGRITKVNDSVAAGFSEATDYAVGDYVTHAGNLYRCTAAHSAGAWNNAHFTRVTVDSELNAEAATRDEQMKSIGVGKVYRATYSGTVSGGVFNVVWETTPTTINIGDIVIIKYTTAQPAQMAAIHLQVGSTYYEIAVGTLAANTTAYYHCSKTPTGSSTATAGELQTAPTNGRLGVVEAKLAKIPVGMIVMWSGSSVPTGWALCDGTNGTPDLRNRFIMGGVLSEQTGYEVKGSTGGAKSNTIGIGNLPAHSHIYVGDSNIPPHWVWDNSLNGFVVDNNNEAGKKLYDKYGMEIYFPKDYDRGTWSINGSAWNRDTGTNWTAASYHNWSADGNGTARLYLSSSTIYAKGNRAATYGTTTPDAIENRPPYYALAFIMFKG